ncbi:MAG: acetyltransferase [Lactobacillus sp.]|jgi:peptidoglycan/LPS O-acetylase OafA/YrhL/transcriptional regulator NrdR family protein|nr:acetyltransferase [Lactobacillus sp.]MCH3906426.1 acetyltransferase [Lactobacillus sp.]MCH3989999.1 acetyltransferase [Lactobacillus sp.]MCH4069287.1 acetyltransferase [Lactobacillus sp.]MCI1303589.1 acetyltransferase [Lactobacillus sp.]
MGRVKNRFISGYSGLRAIAVIGVILYHLNPKMFIGGYLGVPIFLVLSGYLVTDHMRASYEQRGFYDTQNFYLRRAKKLYPQLITVLWLSSAYILLFQRNLLAKLNQIVFTNLLNVYNFWQIANGQSYFARFAANESPFVHLWTMSIEAQFYIIWPLVILLLFKFCHRTKTKVWIILVLTALSALEMAMLFKPGQDTSRIYYGTDTRFFSLGLGAALAFIWPTNRLTSRISQHDTLLLDITGGVSLFAMLFMGCSHIMDPQAPFAYRGGMLLFSLFTTVLVAVIADPGSHWNRWLTNAVFNWIGSRSYGIYLYQFPVMIFFEDKVQNVADHLLLYQLIELALILGISEITYRLIEKPFGKLTWRQTKAFFAKLFAKRGTWQQYTLTGLAALILVLGSVAIGKAPTVKAVNPNKSQLAKTISKNRKQQERDNQAIIKKRQTQQQDSNQSKLYEDAKAAAKRKPVNREYERYGISQIDLQVAKKLPVTAVGDSVMAGSSAELKKIMPNALIDAAVSRSVAASVQIFKQYKAKNSLSKTIIIGLGTNGAFMMSDLDQIMHLAGPKRQVFWLNTHVPTRPWQGQVNDELAHAARRYRNLTIIDWYGYSNPHPDWFYQDQTHLKPLGAKYYAAFVAREVVQHELREEK